MSDGDGAAVVRCEDVIGKSQIGQSSTAITISSESEIRERVLNHRRRGIHDVDGASVGGRVAAGIGGDVLNSIGAREIGIDRTVSHYAQRPGASILRRSARIGKHAVALDGHWIAPIERELGRSRIDDIDGASVGSRVAAGICGHILENIASQDIGIDRAVRCQAGHPGAVLNRGARIGKRHVALDCHRVTPKHRHDRQRRIRRVEGDLVHPPGILAQRKRRIDKARHRITPAERVCRRGQPEEIGGPVDCAGDAARQDAIGIKFQEIIIGLRGDLPPKADVSNAAHDRLHPAFLAGVNSAALGC